MVKNINITYCMLLKKYVRNPNAYLQNCKKSNLSITNSIYSLIVTLNLNKSKHISPHTLKTKR